MVKSMKKISILFVMLFCASVMFAQNVAKHPKNGYPIIISDNGTWEYIPETGIFTDSRDGKTYKTVAIGTQIWMAENLAYKASSGCYAYDNDSSYLEKYGYLYNWETAKNVCPEGWHLPSDEEWKTFEQNLGMTETEVNTGIYRGSAANVGARLKSTTDWKLYEGQRLGNNETGFNALPGGYRRSDGSSAHVEEFCFWWASTPKENDDGGAWRRYLYYHSSVVGRYPGLRTDGYSVRCLKNN